MDGGPLGKGRGAITGLPCRGTVMSSSRRGIGTTVFARCITGGPCRGVGAIMFTPWTVFITGAPCGGGRGGSTVKDPCSVGRAPGAPYNPPPPPRWPGGPGWRRARESWGWPRQPGGAGRRRAGASWGRQRNPGGAGVRRTQMDCGRPSLAAGGGESRTCRIYSPEWVRVSGAGGGCGSKEARARARKMRHPYIRRRALRVADFGIRPWHRGRR